MSCNVKCNGYKGHQEVHVDGKVSEFAKRAKVSPKGNASDIPAFVQDFLNHIKEVEGIDAEVKVIKVPINPEKPEHVADAIRYAMASAENEGKASENTRRKPKNMGMSREDNPIAKIIEECDKVGMELVDISMTQGSLNQLLLKYPEYFEVDEYGDVSVSKKKTNISMIVTPDDQLGMGDIKIVDMGMIDCEEDISSLVDHLMSAPAPTAGIKMSGLTLDAITEVLANEHDTKPLTIKNQILIPCGGFMMVDIDNDMEFGVVKLTNRI